jgi:hypothetical protein
VCGVDFGTPGGVGFVLVSPDCVTSQTFVEIEENIFFSFFSLLCEREVEEHEEGQWNKETSCIFGQTRLSWKKQFSVFVRDFEHYTPRDGLRLESTTDSNLNHRALVVVAQIMDLDLGNESDTHLAESLLQQDKEDGSGGSEVMIEISSDSNDDILGYKT